MTRLLDLIGWDRPTKLASLGRRRRLAPNSDRRASHRHPARENRARLGWWVGRSFHECAAQFQDASSGGALLLIDGLPSAKEVWVRLEEPMRIGWYPARIVRIESAQDGLQAVGVMFPELCHYDLFKTIVHGMDLGGRAEATSPEFENCYWR